MIRRFWLAVLLLFPLWASAAVGDLVAPSQYRIPLTYNSVTSYYYTPGDYCQAYLVSIGATGANAWSCSNTTVTSTAFSQLSQAWTWTVTAPGGSPSVRTGSASAYCDPAYYVGPGAYNASDPSKYWCKVINQPPVNCTDTNPFIRKFYYTSSPYIGPSNYAGCQIVALELLVCRTDATGLYCMWKVQRNGQVYSGPDVQNGGKAGDAPEVKTDPPTKSPPLPGQDPKACPSCVPCPSGTVQAGSDSSGIPICMGTGTAPPDPPKTPTTTTGPATTTSNSDGSSTTVQSTVQANSDGSTTTTKTTTTTAADGTVTVSKDVTVSNTPTGSAGRTDTPSSDQNNLCKQNPNLSICQNSSVSGTCGTISCTGDAIQCATLRAAAALQCQQQQEQDDLKASGQYTLGQAAATGADPMAASLPSTANASTVTMPSSLDQSGWLGSDAGVADVTFTVQGKSITIPLAKVTGYLVGLRYALMIVALLSSFRMLSGVIFRE